jgi:hypothetical protein
LIRGIIAMDMGSGSCIMEMLKKESSKMTIFIKERRGKKLMREDTNSLSTRMEKNPSDYY